MKKEKKIFEFWGSCQIISSMPLEILARKISSKLFGDAQFIEGERSIWEEIPSLYIDSSIMGMLVVLGGYGSDEGYTLSISPYGEWSRYIHSKNLNEILVKKNLDFYLFHILSQAFHEETGVKILNPG
jgi:hypothetical protein